MHRFLATFALFNLVSFIYCACPAGSFKGVKPEDCFMYRETRKTIFDADNDCKALSGFLASIHDSATNKLIGAQLKKIDTYANKSVWIGGMIDWTLVDAEWVWSDKTPFDFQAFAPGKNGTKVYQYAVFNVSDNTWYATFPIDDESGALPYLCEVPNPSFTTPKPTHYPCPRGSFPGINLTDCFMFQNVTLNWNDSKIACNGNGGNLASIHDAFTNNLIKNQLATLTNGIKQTIWLGGESGYDCGDFGCSYYFEWVDHTDIDYANFATGHYYPSSGINIAFNSGNGQWYSASTDEEYPSLCKVVPV